MSRSVQHLFLGLLLLFSFLSISYSVRALDITDSKSVTVSALVGSLPTPDSGGGGGGSASSAVRFSGFAYPGGTVTLQENSVTLQTVSTAANGTFSLTLSESGTKLFTLFATDIDGRRSTVLNFPTVLYTGRLTDISGIRFAPTIAIDKLAMKPGDYLTVQGAAVFDIPLELTIRGLFDSVVFTPVADAGGHYSITVPITLPVGEYTVMIGYSGDDRTSKAVRLVVGTATIYQIEATTNIPGDYNLDQKVTLADFSVLAYWFGKKNPPATVDINKDGVISLVDFSIMAFYWNG